MFVSRLACQDFRNLTITLELGSGYNVFAGRNGQGKTNVLEALYVTCFGRSFRPGKLVHLIRHGAGQARVQATVDDGDVQTELSLELTETSKRHGAAGKENCGLAEVASTLRMVFFGPDDLALVKGAPALRREFLDRAIWVHYPPYADLMKRYVQHMRSRNRLLKEQREQRRKVAPELLASVEELLCKEGAQVVSYRLKYLRELVPEAVRLVHDHTAGALALGVSYLPSIEGPLAEMDQGAIASKFLAALEAVRTDDYASCSTSVGPHVDDMEFTLNARPARFFGSQGEQRAVAVCFKLAQLALWTERFGVKPVLLLDDVSSELDAERTALLMSTISKWGIQTLLTTTSPPDVLLGDPEVRVFRVEGGRVQQHGT